MIEYPIAVGGIVTRVIEAGTGDAVLLIHGAGAHAGRWRATVGRLGSQGLRTLAVDLPGHGFADKGETFRYSVPAYADYLLGVLDALSIERAFLVGNSLGGHIASYIAVKAQDRIKGLALVGAVGVLPVAPETGEAIRRGMRLTARENIEARLRTILVDSTIVTEALVEEEWRLANAPGAARTFAQLGDYIADQSARDNVLDRLAELAPRLPVLLLWGAQDRAAPPALGEQLARRLGVAGPTLIDGAGHAPFLDKPPEFDRAVVAFLR